MARWPQATVDRRIGAGRLVGANHKGKHGGRETEEPGHNKEAKRGTKVVLHLEIGCKVGICGEGEQKGLRGWVAASDQWSRGGRIQQRKLKSGGTAELRTICRGTRVRPQKLARRHSDTKKYETRERRTSALLGQRAVVSSLCHLCRD